MIVTVTYDGDALSGSAVLSIQGNKSIDDFIFSLNGIIKPDRSLRFQHNGATMAGLYALSRSFLPEERARLQPRQKK